MKTLRDHIEELAKVGTLQPACRRYFLGDHEAALEAVFELGLTEVAIPMDTVQTLLPVPEEVRFLLDERAAKAHAIDELGKVVVPAGTVTDEERANVAAFTAEAEKLGLTATKVNDVPVGRFAGQRDAHDFTPQQIQELERSYTHESHAMPFEIDPAVVQEAAEVLTPNTQSATYPPLMTNVKVVGEWPELPDEEPAAKGKFDE